MIKLRNFFILTTLAIILTSCPYGGYKYNTGFLPTSPVNLADFNTKYDDYNMSAPTIDELMPIYFSSNKNSSGNDFDIYLCDLPASKTFVEALVDSVISPEILLSEELSSSSDDKCPSINFNVLVFTSYRPGGEGGFDLWYSIKEGTGWTEP